MADKCVIDFDLNPLEDAGYSGADLALYKAQEPGPHRDYLIYIIHVTGEGTGYIAAHKPISSSCSGWQVFHLYDYFAYSVKQGEQAKFRIIISATSYKQLSCREIANLFLLQATFDEPEASGGGNLYTMDEEEENLLIPESSSRFNIPPDDWIDYIPTLNLFNANVSRTKRDATGTSEGVKVSENTRRCYRAQKMVILPEYVSDRPYTVELPLDFDVGECQTEWLYSKQTCAPTKYRKVAALVKGKGGGLSVLFWLPDVVIEECGWVDDIQDITPNKI